MGDTAISWTDKTWNPIRGCSRVSEGCRHCYAEQVAARFSGPGQPYEGLAKKVGGEARWTGEVRFIEEHLTDPLRWRKPCRIFVNSMSDLFHEEVSDEWLDRIFAVMALAPQHTYQVLTKRPERMVAYMTSVVGGQRPLCSRAKEISGSFIGGLMIGDAHHALEGSTNRTATPPYTPWTFLHLGVSVENQATADERIPLLLQTPAAVRWISAEPLLGEISFRWAKWDDGAPHPRRATQLPDVPRDGKLLAGCHGHLDGLRMLDWVVVGGESGAGHRPMQIEWLESIVNQCRVEGVPVWVKQDSGPKPGKQGRIPDHLWVQEFPCHAREGL